jgi:hypothetical protein
MHTGLRLALLSAASIVLVGCADPRYNLDVRNMTGEVVNLDLVCKNPKENGGDPRVVTRSRVAPGSNTSMFTQSKRGDRAHLEARVDGDTESEPATLDITSGLSSIDIIGMPAGSATRVRLREVVRE